MPFRDSTHAYIGYIAKNNKIKYGYIHSHGCPKFLGKILLCSYNTQKRVEKLLVSNSFEASEHGIKILNMNEPHETNSIDGLITEFLMNSIEYVYLFDGNRWLVAGSTKIKDDLVFLTEELVAAHN